MSETQQIEYAVKYQNGRIANVRTKGNAVHVAEVANAKAAEVGASGPVATVVRRHVTTTIRATHWEEVRDV